MINRYDGNNITEYRSANQRRAVDTEINASNTETKKKLLL